MDEITREVATRYLQQIEQFGTRPPELLDAVLHGTEIVIILCDGRKLRFETTDDDAPRAKPRTSTAGQREVSEPFAYIEEDDLPGKSEKTKAESKPKKGKTKS